MCGRFVATSGLAELEAEFAVHHVVGPDVAPSWNVAPTQPVRIVLERYWDNKSNRDPSTPTSSSLLPGADRSRELLTVSWGLIPHWAKDPSIGTRMINARSETLTEKPAFRAAAARRRCLIPADGYFEWMSAAKGAAPRDGRTARKTPYYLHDPGHHLLAMAGLYEIWRDPALPDDDPAALRWTCTVITRAAPDALGHIHDRSPVTVPPHLRSEWLDCSDTNAATARDLLAEFPAPRLVPRQVGRAVGNVRNNSPSLIDPVDAGPTQALPMGPASTNPASTNPASTNPASTNEEPEGLF